MNVVCMYVCVVVMVVAVMALIFVVVFVVKFLVDNSGSSRSKQILSLSLWTRMVT
jgi:hypothetical protein